MDCFGNSLGDWEDGLRLGYSLRLRTTYAVSLRLPYQGLYEVTHSLGKQNRIYI